MRFSEQIIVRCTPEQKKALMKEAGKTGISVLVRKKLFGRPARKPEAA